MVGSVKIHPRIASLSAFTRFAESYVAYSVRSVVQVPRWLIQFYEPKPNIFINDTFHFFLPSQIATFLTGPRFKITTSMAKARFKPGRCTFMAYLRPFASMLYLGVIGGHTGPLPSSSFFTMISTKQLPNRFLHRTFPIKKSSTKTRCGKFKKFYHPIPIPSPSRNIPSFMEISWNRDTPSFSSIFMFFLF